MSSAAFQTYAVCACILAIEMLLTGNDTTMMRMRNKGFVNAEDAKSFGGASSEQERPAVARAICYFIGYASILGMAIQVGF